MSRSPLSVRLTRYFRTSAPERGRRRRGFESEFLRRIEPLEDRALLATVTVHVADYVFTPSRHDPAGRYRPLGVG